MTHTRSIHLGTKEVSLAAIEVLRSAQHDADTLFQRHSRCDWGEVPGWLQQDNDNAAEVPHHTHAIQSHYQYEGLPLLLVITARDRSRTRLLLHSEFGELEIGLKEGYALWARDYDYPNPLITVEEPIINPILERLLPVISALDVGTGTGRIARKLARSGTADVYGVDATPEMLEVARISAEREGLASLHLQMHLIGEAPLPFPENKFDLLTCCLMLSHVSDLKGAIRDCVRVVHTGGWILLSDFHPAVSTFGWHIDYVSPDARYLLPHPVHTRQEYLDALTSAGCVLHEIHDIALGGEPYGDASPEAVAAQKFPPLCLVILAQKIVD